MLKLSNALNLISDYIVDGLQGLAAAIHSVRRSKQPVHLPATLKLGARGSPSSIPSLHFRNFIGYDNS